MFAVPLEQLRECAESGADLALLLGAYRDELAAAGVGAGSGVATVSGAAPVSGAVVAPARLWTELDAVRTPGLPGFPPIRWFTQ